MFKAANQTVTNRESVINPVSEKSSMQLSHTDTVESTSSSRATHLDRWLILVIAVCTVVWPGPASAITVLDVDTIDDVATQLISDQGIEYTTDASAKQLGDLVTINSTATASNSLGNADASVLIFDAKPIALNGEGFIHNGSVFGYATDLEMDFIDLDDNASPAQMMTAPHNGSLDVTNLADHRALLRSVLPPGTLQDVVPTSLTLFDIGTTMPTVRLSDSGATASTVQVSDAGQHTTHRTTGQRRQRRDTTRASRTRPGTPAGYQRGQDRSLANGHS